MKVEYEHHEYHKYTSIATIVTSRTDFSWRIFGTVTRQAPKNHKPGQDEEVHEYNRFALYTISRKEARISIVFVRAIIEEADLEP